MQRKRSPVSTPTQRATNPQLVRRLREARDGVTGSALANAVLNKIIDEVEARLCPKPPEKPGRKNP